MSRCWTCSVGAAVLASALFLAGCGKDNSTGPRTPAGWSRSYGLNVWSVGRSVRQTRDGGYIVAGWTGPSESSADVLLLKTDANGDSLWARTFDAPTWASGASVLQTAGGYLVLADYQGHTGEFWLIQTEADGSVAWTEFKGYGDRDETACEAQRTSDDGYILVGTTNLGGGDTDIWLVKTTAGLVTQWNATKGYSSRQESGASVQQTADGGYLTVGTTYGDGLGHAVWLVKTYADGVTHWHRIIPTGEAWGRAIRRTDDGTYVVMADVVQDGQRIVGLFGYDDAGNPLWYGMSDVAGDLWGGAVQQTGDRGFMVAGTRRLDAGSGGDFCLIKFAATTNDLRTRSVLWTRILGSGDDDCHSGVQTSDGGYILCGSTATSGVAGCRVLLVKTDEDGNVE